MRVALLVIVLIAALGYCVFGLLSLPFQRVSRERLEKFARRQSLRITVDNGPLVIRYLATTRRWRGGLLLLSVGATLVWPLVAGMLWPGRSSGAQLNALALFAGWFVGAVIAEWRVSVAGTAPRRAAMLQPRRLADYVPRPSRVLPLVAWFAVAGYELAGLGYLAVRHPRGLPVLVGWMVLTAVGAAVFVAVGRQVLLRPQRFSAPDLLAADAALRSRSLHVLAGCALAVAAYLLSGVTNALTPYVPALTDGAASPLLVAGMLLGPVLGLIIATSSVPPTGPRPRGEPASSAA